MHPNIIKYLSWYPFFAVNLGHQGFGIWRKCILTSVAVVGVLSSVSVISHRELRSISDFVDISTQALFFLPALTLFWYIWRTDCRCKLYHHCFHGYIGTRLSLGSQGWFILIWDISGFICFLLSIWRVEEFSLAFMCHNVVWTVLAGSVSQLTIDKFLLAKRLNGVVKNGNLIEELAFLRTMVDLNTHVNEFYSFIVTGCCLVNMSVVTKAMATAWEVYRFLMIHQDLPVFLLQCLWSNTHQLLMAFCCSSIGDELGAIQWELQRQASQENSPISRRQLIHAIIAELSHTDAEFTCLGFVIVNLGAASAVMGFNINILMIFIQFMQG